MQANCKVGNLGQVPYIFWPSSNLRYCLKPELGKSTTEPLYVKVYCRGSNLALQRLPWRFYGSPDDVSCCTLQYKLCPTGLLDPLDKNKEAFQDL